MAPSLAPSLRLPAPHAVQRHHTQTVLPSRCLQKHPVQVPAACQAPLARARLVRAAASEESDGIGVQQQPVNQQQQPQQRDETSQQAAATAAAAAAAEVAPTPPTSTAGKRLKLVATLLVVTTSAVANRVLYKVGMLSSTLHRPLPLSARRASPIWQLEHPGCTCTRDQPEAACPPLGCWVWYYPACSCHPQLASNPSPEPCNVPCPTRPLAPQMSLVPLGNYVFFLAQLQTFGYLLVYFGVLALRYKRVLHLRCLPHCLMAAVQASNVAVAWPSNLDASCCQGFPDCIPSYN